MAIALRLSRGGAKKRPYYRIVAADVRSPRDGKYLEQVGIYNPLLAKDDEGRVKLNEDRVRYWLGVGGKPSDRVARFLDAAGILERAARSNPNKGKPGEKATERAEEKAEKAEAAKAAEEEAKNAPVEEAVVEEAAENDATGSVKTEETAEAVAESSTEAPADATAEDATAIAEEVAEGGPVAEETPAEEASEDKAEG
ncbi:MAG: 30S ribosomal protein S16 [Pontixanthobacter sp.]